MDSGDLVSEIVRSHDRPHSPLISAIVPFGSIPDNGHLVLEDWAGDDTEIIVVDDGAPVESTNRIRHALEKIPHWTLIRLSENHGAGIARNVGRSHVSGEFSVFLDVDDELDMAQLLTTTKLLSLTSADVAFCTYDQVSADLPHQRIGMWPKDQAIWEKVCGPTGRKAVMARPDDSTDLLRFTNFPWNKVYRSSFLRSLPTPLFGSTPIHNDILGHWITLLFAEEVLMVDSPFTLHIRHPLGTSLTSRLDSERVTAGVAALRELASFLNTTAPHNQDVAGALWAFMKDISANTHKYLSSDSDREKFRNEQRTLIREFLSPDTVFHLTDNDPTLLEWLVKR